MGRKGYYYSIQQCFFSSAINTAAVSPLQRKTDRIPSSPWSIISFSCCSGKFSSKKTKEETKKKKDDGDQYYSDQQQVVEIAESMDGGGSTSSAKRSGQGREVCFNMGVGFGIIAASKYELNKIVELSKQMENLIRDLKKKKKLPLQNTQVHYPEPSVGSASDATTAEQIRKSYSVNRPEMDMKAKANEKMDQLEAELEVEMEHLQVRLDNEIVTNCEHTKTEISIEDSAPEESCYDDQAFEIEEPEESEVNGIMENNYNNGVCPVELERRLHKLLAKRQEEKIKALESALDSAIQKVRQNQKELSWWKDTATLVFQKIAFVPSHH